jgi:hypothetical protein
VRDRRGRGDDLGTGQQALVALSVGALADHREVDLTLRQRTEQAVDIAAETTPISGNSSGVD